MVDYIATSEQTKIARNADRVAVPWILGLYSLAGATFMVGTRWAGWYRGSGAESQFLLVPFAAALGGIALLAAFWAFLASDGLATAMLGTWGSFWIGYGLLNALFMLGKLTAPAGPFSELGYWFIALAAISWMGAVAAMAENMALAGTLAFLAAGSTISAIGNVAGHPSLVTLAGWLFFIGAAFCWYTASGMMFQAVFHRPVLPLGLSTTVEQPLPARGAGSGEVAVLGQTPASRRSG